MLTSKKPKFLLLYGPPGAGKTTVADALSTDDTNYINLALDPEFGEKPLTLILRENLTDSNTITEGCFPKKKFRETILKTVEESHQPICIYIKEEAETLTNRRNRSVSEYQTLLEDFQIGHDKYDHHILELPSTEERIQRIQQILES